MGIFKGNPDERVTSAPLVDPRRHAYAVIFLNATSETLDRVALSYAQRSRPGQLLSMTTWRLRPGERRELYLCAREELEHYTVEAFIGERRVARREGPGRTGGAEGGEALSDGAGEAWRLTRLEEGATP